MIFFSVLVTILPIHLEVFCVSSEQILDSNENLEEKQDWSYTQNGKLKYFLWYTYDEYKIKSGERCQNQVDSFCFRYRQ